MHVLPAMAMDFSTISRAESFVFSISAMAADFAYDAAGADGGDGIVRVDDVAGAADDIGGADIGDQQQGFQMTQHAVRSPVLGKFDDGARKVAVMLFELRFKAREEREGVGGGAGEPGHDLSVIKTAKFLGGGFQNLRALGDLSIAGHHDFAVAAHA